MKYISQTGERIETTSLQEKSLHLLYDTLFGRLTLKLFTSPCISKLGGYLLSTKASTLLIPSFVKQNNICLEDYVKASYDSYNDFFTRQIKSSKRPICQDAHTLISPSDGKVSVYPINENSIFTIKNTQYTMNTLLQDESLAKSYANGYCIQIRLTVDDYHRYCYIDEGTKGISHFIPGKLHTVNPIAFYHTPVYKENSREYTLLHTKNFGSVIQMEVGAMMVGKITNHKNDTHFTKGQEKGYFEFGGSTVLLFIQEGQVVIREDLIQNTLDGYETVIRMGEPLGNTFTSHL